MGYKNMAVMKGKIVCPNPPLWWPVFEEPYQVVGSLLYWDVGLTVASCDLYINEALAVLEGRSPTSERGGNGHIVRLMPTWVLIANIYLEDISPVIIAIDAYVSALRYWNSVLNSWDGVNLPSNPPEFSYEDPQPTPRLSPEEIQQEIEATLSHWRGYEPPHHISQLKSESENS